MKILHHIGIPRQSTTSAEKIRKIGIKLEQYIPKLVVRSGANGPLYFEISEDDPRWKDVAKLLQEQAPGENRIWDRVWTEFTPKERDDARFLSVGTVWTNGYPEPSDVSPAPGARYLPYFSSTYDLSDYCPACSTGAVQNAPFRFRKPPAWGRRSILQLNWVSDELFVRPEVWREIFQPFGIGHGPVILHKTSAAMISVVQLTIPQETTLKLAALPYKTCFQCGRRKYAPVCHGCFPPPPEMAPAMSKSVEYFGGDTAFKAIIVSSQLYKKIKEAEIKGVDFLPCGQ